MNTGYNAACGMSRGMAAWGMIAAAVLAGLLGHEVAARMPVVSERDFPPAVQFVGHDSQIAQERFVLVNTHLAWEALWREHRGLAGEQGPPTRHVVPKIDFLRYCVVGYFRGDGVNCDGEVATEVHVANGQVRIRFTTSTFQTASLGPDPDPGVKTRSFGLWVIERHKGLIVLERERMGLKDEAPSWSEVARLSEP